jgi:predicted flavoprotein YhiN
MLNWDAPTGGFLIQGCFSMGNYVAKSILEKENGTEVIISK